MLHGVECSKYPVRIKEIIQSELLQLDNIDSQRMESKYPYPIEI